MYEAEVKRIFNVKNVNEIKKLNDCDENMFEYMKKKCSCIYHKKSQLNMSLHI